MRAFVAKGFLVAGMIGLGVAAQAFQFSVLANGTFMYSTLIDNESVDYYYYNPGPAIPVDTLVFNANTQSGVLAGPGDVDVMDFSFSVDNTQQFGSQVNQELHWAYTGGTGQFANLSGVGSVSIDFSFIDSNTAQTTATMTGELTPEPCSMIALGLGVLAIARRRRASRQPVTPCV